MKTLSELFSKLTAKIFTTDQLKFSKIIIKNAVVQDIIDFAKTTYPKEFVAVLEGKVTNSTLLVEGLFYQPFQSSRQAAVMRQNLPLTANAIGTVHSHPSPSNTPSQEDLKFFSRGGIIHLIIGYPFTEYTLACYTLSGEKCKIDVSD